MQKLMLLGSVSVLQRMKQYVLQSAGRVDYLHPKMPLTYEGCSID